MLCTEALRAQYCAAEAEIAIAEGGHGIATRQLRQSVRHWREVGSRTGEVEARLRLAECLLADDDASAAELELHAIAANLAAAAPYRERIAELRRALAAQPAAGEKR
jgi:thioredoxin-like negative regulator of GroEL